MCISQIIDLFGEIRLGLYSLSSLLIAVQELITLIYAQLKVFVSLFRNNNHYNNLYLTYPTSNKRKRYYLLTQIVEINVAAHYEFEDWTEPEPRPNIYSAKASSTASRTFEAK